MAFTVKEDATSGTYTQDDRVRSRTRVYILQSDDFENDTSYDALNAAGVPSVGDVDGEDIYLTCIKKSVKYRLQGEAKFFDVTCEFANQTSFPGVYLGSQTPEQSYYDDPTLRPPVYAFGSYTISVPAYETIAAFTSGVRTPITASNGEMFDPQPTVPLEVQTFTMTRYEAITGNALRLKIKDFSNKVNNTAGSPIFNTIMQVNEHQARLRITANGVWESQAFYWVVTYNVELFRGFPTGPAGAVPADIKASGWQLALLDQGTYFYPGGVDAVTVAQSFVSLPDNNPITGNLNGNGDKSDATQPVFLKFDVMEDVGFDDEQLNLFNLPASP